MTILKKDLSLTPEEFKIKFGCEHPLVKMYKDKNYKAYSVRPARYAKGYVAVTCPSIDGFKTRASRLAAAIARNRYTHRETAYLMTPLKALKFEDLYKAGYDAGTMSLELIPPASIREAS